MFEVLAHNILAEHLFGHTFDPPRGDSGYARLLAPDRRPYPTKDGHVCALMYTDEQWRRFFERIGRPELSGDPRFADLGKRTTHVVALYKLLADTLIGRTTAEWLELFEQLDIPAGPLNSIESLLKDEHLHAVKLVERTVHPSEGAMWSLGNPINWGDSTKAPLRPAPKLGEHSREILAEAGYDDAAIAELLRRGVTLAPADA
jgi:crotonobetainyl-CoA:carnitine CoA-transferase CaiB-like acyl-CoA transferase